jgi:cytochrome oxidase assembly protein ShyY1
MVLRNPHRSGHWCWPARCNPATIHPMRKYLLTKTSIICLILALGMIKASFWQWDRHVQKQELIKTLQATLTREPAELLSLAQSQTMWSSEAWRRVHFSGSYDFEHEVIVRRNRGKQDHAGFHVITPLKLDNSNAWVLVDRGFVPLGREGREYRKKYHTETHVEAYGLLKESQPPKLFAPADPPTGPGKDWADIWIRVNVEAMQKQLPYAVLPIYVELMESPDDPLLAEKIVKEGSAGRNDVLALTGQKQVENFGMDSPDTQYPIPHFDTTPPPDIHLGYVYEWAFMALLTIGIGVVLQLPRFRPKKGT